MRRKAPGPKDSSKRVSFFPSESESCPLAPDVLLPKVTRLTLRDCLVVSRGTLAETVLSRRRQRDGPEADLRVLQRLGVTNDVLHKEDINSILSSCDRSHILTLPCIR